MTLKSNRLFRSIIATITLTSTFLFSTSNHINTSRNIEIEKLTATKFTKNNKTVKVNFLSQKVSAVAEDSTLKFAGQQIASIIPSKVNLSLGSTAQARENYRTVLSKQGARNISDYVVGRTVMLRSWKGACFNAHQGSKKASFLVGDKPRLFLLNCNRNDKDQWITFFRNNHGGVGLRIEGLSNNGSLNVQRKYRYNGAPIATWPAQDSGSEDMNFEVWRLSSGKWIILKNGLAIDAPYGTGAGRNSTGKLKLHEPTYNNVKQQFTPIFLKGGGRSIPSTQSKKKTEYELWLVSRRMAKPYPSFPNGTPEVGHSWIAVIQNTGSGWKVKETFGYWPKSGKPVDTGIIKLNSSEFQMTSKILSGKKHTLSPRGTEVRKIKISEKSIKRVKDNAFYNGVHCDKYTAFPATYRDCNCITFAARLWYLATNKQENFMHTLSLTPDILANRMARETKSLGGNEFFGNKKTF